MATLTENDHALDAAIARAFATKAPPELVDGLTDSEYERLVDALRHELTRTQNDKMSCADKLPCR